MRRFVLNRNRDVSGVSGSGVVADGVVFDDGVAVLHWRGRWHTTEVLRSVQDVVNIHGHDGATVIEYLDHTVPFPDKPRDFGEA